MELKIGFKDTPRELAVDAKGDAEELSREIRQAVERGEGVLSVTDERDRSYLVRVDTVAWVELGSSAPRTVGFAGA